MNLPLKTPARGQAAIHSREQTLTVTIVICTRNRPVVLQKCLAAVGQLTPAPDQVLVVDNSEGNVDTRKVAEDSGARYTVEPVRGLSRARNRGLTECSTDIVAFLDDDVTPAPDWLGLLLAPFADEQTGATAGRVITPDSLSLNGKQQSPITLSSKDPHWFEIATFGGLGLGANMALRRKFCPSSFFDERLGRGAPFQIGEESHAFAWLLSRGYKVAYLPSAVVYHPPIHRDTISHEARNSITYWLLLFSDFPKQRKSLIRFIVRRLRRKPLEWPREPQEPGEIVTSGWHVLFRAGIHGLWLFLRTPRPIARPK